MCYSVREARGSVSHGSHGSFARPCWPQALTQVAASVAAGSTTSQCSSPWPPLICCPQVDEEDVARARNQLKASILFSQDGTTGELGLCATKFSCHGYVRGCKTPRSEFRSCPPNSPLPTPPPGVAEDIGRNLLVYGRRLPKAELFARIDAVRAGCGGHFVVPWGHRDGTHLTALTSAHCPLSDLLPFLLLLPCPAPRWTPTPSRAWPTASSWTRTLPSPPWATPRCCQVSASGVRSAAAWA